MHLKEDYMETLKWIVENKLKHGLVQEIVSSEKLVIGGDLNAQIVCPIMC